MKKNIFKVALAAAFALIAGYNVYNAQKEELALSDLMLDNVEALANSGESSRPCEEGCYPYSGWRCTRILGGVSSVCDQHRKK